MLRPFQPNSDDNTLFGEEARLARARGLTPLRFRMELVATYLEQPFENETPVVFTCERRGFVFATSPAEQLLGSKRRFFEDSIVLDVLVLRKPGFDECTMANDTEVVSNGEPLSGFDPVMTRFTLREGTSEGMVADCVAIDLSKFILGAHGIVEKDIELQLGSKVSMRITTDLHGTITEETASLHAIDDEVDTNRNTGAAIFKDSTLTESSNCLQGTDSEDPLGCSPQPDCGKHTRSEDACISILEPSVPALDHGNAKIPSDENSCSPRHEKLEDVPESVDLNLPGDARKIVEQESHDPHDDAYVEQGQENRDPHDDTCIEHGSGETHKDTLVVEPSKYPTVDRTTIKGGELGLLVPAIENELEENSSNAKEDARTALENGSYQAAQVTDSEMMNKEAGEPSKIWTEFPVKVGGEELECVASDEDSAKLPLVEAQNKRSRSASQVSYAGDTDSASGASECSEMGRLSEVEYSLEHENFPSEPSRMQLEDHPFTAIITLQSISEPYSCTVEEGLWQEFPVLAHVACPFPLSMWTIQGPEEIDPDDEEDMMDIGDGLLGPKRNIAQLQAAASCSNIRQGTPAFPGRMSPLQRAKMWPSRTREAMVIALGRPPQRSLRTVLAVSKEFQNDVKPIEEPDLSDSEFDGSEDEGDMGFDIAVDGGSESDSDVNAPWEPLTKQNSGIGVQDKGNEMVANVGSSCDGQDCAEGENEKDSNGDAVNEQIIRETASQIAELMNKVNELDAEAFSVKQVLKKIKTLAADLCSEREYLKSLLDEKEMQGIGEAGPEQGNTLKDEISKLEHDRGEYRANLETMQTELNGAKEENEAALKGLKQLQEDMVSKNSLRVENERLLSVILGLKNELDRDPGSPDVLDMLNATKAELKLKQEETQKLRNELAELKVAKKKKNRNKKGPQALPASPNLQATSPTSVTQF